ncbi:B12-binding domain-containing radical SAM protein [Clostridium felsineum]|uniref:B12-binding domain-containing radical SAM protein n=1 Tax=Clostridium felsineum TaxID=36839 RepID=UPI00098CA813|nr:radical SAM protein [Clostridium felsineum]URZ17237.1 tRNA-2-methylthio-N(6)-dimethylallyladenosine synthase [Clostridium felsineum DSM 794]
MNETRKNLDEKILLVLLPFWTPLIPPLGISCLKGYLEKNGYKVTTNDANVKNEFTDIYHKYFNVLRNAIPEDKRGNFYNIGHNVLQNHMMVYINCDKDFEILKTTKTLIKEYYFTIVDEEVLNTLNGFINEFFKKMEVYIGQLIDENKPSIVGLSVFTGTLAPSLFTFRLIKNKWPNIRTIMGGGIFSDHLRIDSPNFKAFMKQSDCIDNIIVGEGEVLFLKLLKGEFPKDQKVISLKDINNNVYDIKHAELPDFSDLNLDDYIQLSAYTSRSCPFQCNFCSETVQWGRYRKKDAKFVVSELMQLHNKYKTQIFLMGDSLLNPIVSDLASEMSKQDISIYWDGYLRADKEVCSIENTLNWRRGGYYRARLGIESGSQRVLNLMGKRITTEQIKKAISSLAYAGIKTTTYWVVGYPGETEEDFQMTLDLIKELKNDLYTAECNPYNYFISGQVGSDKLALKGISPLFNEEMANNMLNQVWVVNGNPSRREIYSRVSRFVKHCNELGIPTPYSLKEVYNADERWKKLQINAVPSIVEFKNSKELIREDRQIKDLNCAKYDFSEDGDFNFI